MLFQKKKRETKERRNEERENDSSVSPRSRFNGRNKEADTEAVEKEKTFYNAEFTE